MEKDSDPAIRCRLEMSISVNLGFSGNEGIRRRRSTGPSVKS